MLIRVIGFFHRTLTRSLLAHAKILLHIWRQSECRFPISRRVDGQVSGSPDETLSYDGSTDIGYNISAPGTLYAGSQGSEMARMFYNTLGSTSIYDTSGNYPQPGYGLSNLGPFVDIQSTFDIDTPIFTAYWSAWDPSVQVFLPYVFAFGIGLQDYAGGTAGVPWDSTNRSWAVHDGDVGVIPIPAAAWLFGSALGLLGWMRRRTA